MPVDKSAGMHTGMAQGQLQALPLSARLLLSAPPPHPGARVTTAAALTTAAEVGELDTALLTQPDQAALTAPMVVR